MRLWHQDLIPFLDRQHLLGQHRKVCALRGKEWGRKHATVDYVFTHEYSWLVLYHEVVMDEMWRRGYRVSLEWKNCYYHGKELGIIETDAYNQASLDDELAWMAETGVPVYPEHNDIYLRECIDLLKQKNAPMDFEEIERELLKCNN